MFNRAYWSLVLGLVAWGMVWFTLQFLAPRIPTPSPEASAFVVVPIMLAVSAPGLIVGGYVSASFASQPGLGSAFATGAIIAVVSIIHCALLSSVPSWRFSFQAFFAPQVLLAIPGTLLGGYLHERVHGWRNARQKHGA